MKNTGSGLQDPTRWGLPTERRPEGIPAQTCYRKRKAGSEEPQLDLVLNAYYLLGYDWREAWKAWKKANLSTPPVMITVCTRTETAVSHHSCRSCSPKEARKEIAIMSPIGYSEDALVEQPAIALPTELGWEMAGIGTR